MARVKANSVTEMGHRGIILGDKSAFMNLVGLGRWEVNEASYQGVFCNGFRGVRSALYIFFSLLALSWNRLPFYFIDTV